MKIMRGASAKSESDCAFLQDPTPCCADTEPAPAPHDDTDIDGRVDCIEPCNCATKNRLTLTFDAYLQHLSEGRIAFAR